jgi:hypothetical protein
MIITFVDAGMLIAAARGRSAISAEAIAILDDPERSFASSEFIRLEVYTIGLARARPIASSEAKFSFQDVKQCFGTLPIKLHSLALLPGDLTRFAPVSINLQKNAAVTLECRVGCFNFIVQ